MTIRTNPNGTLRLTEADVTGQVCDFLQAEGWREFRNNVGTMVVRNGRSSPRYVNFGEKGMPDWRFAKPTGCSYVYEMFIEMKAPGKKLDPDQVEWHRAATQRGFLCLVVDNFEEFKAYYEGQFGWMRANRKDWRIGAWEAT